MAKTTNRKLPERSKTQPPEDKERQPAPPVKNEEPAAAPKAPPEVDPERPRLEVVLKKDMALGHGTRKAGTVLGYLSCAPGCHPGEILDALRTPGLAMTRGLD